LDGTEKAFHRPSIEKHGDVMDHKAMRPNGEVFRGVYYREHPTRIHGMVPDRYYFLKFWGHGKTMTEGIGWASDGVKPTDAHKRLIDIKAALRAGTYEPPKERKDRERVEREAAALVSARQKKEKITLGQFFNEKYMPAQAGKKEKTLAREEELFRLHIEPYVGMKTFGDVSQFDVERIKARLVRAGKSGRTIQYCLAVLRQVFNTARQHGIHSLESPTSRVKKIKFDNRRVRHLSESEAELLLNKIYLKTKYLYRQCVLSLHAGLRFGEIASLTWGDVDLARGILTLRDTKNSKTRSIPITRKVRREVFGGLVPSCPDDLVFPDSKGRKLKAVSAVFRRTVDEMGLNAGVSDPRQKVVFHTLRHTFASWLVERGVDLIVVSRLLGHSSISLTERYSHLRPDSLRAAVKVLDDDALSELKKASEP